ncbi:MAG: hypothetical protein VX946_03725 [Pseudomonadota bacterium]|nr:hypothetical protein [Pseudomonadota bacterium]
MARVPDYTSPQVQSRPVGAPGFSMRAPDASGLVRGIEQAERGFMEHVEQEREKADTAALMNADRQLTEWQNSAMFDPENGVYAKKGANALGITAPTLEAFEQEQQRIGAALGNEQQRARFEQIVANRRNSFNADLNRYEYRERQSFYDDTEKGQLQTQVETAALYYNDPEKISYLIGKTNAINQARAARLGLSPDAAGAESLGSTSAIMAAAVGRMVNDNPYQARDYFNQNRGLANADTQARIDNLIDREIRSREIEARQMQAIARAELSSRIQDASAAYTNGLDFANPPTREEFIGAYGEEGAERYQQFEQLQSMAPDIRAIFTASPEEQRQMVEQYDPAASGVASDGYQFDARLQGTIIQAVTAAQRERQDDPAAYAAKYSPLLQRAAEGLDSGDPAATEAYAAAMLGEQARMGVEQPRLLTKGQASASVRQFAVTSDGGSNAAELIEQLQAQWGKHWPSVYQQLQSDLPGEALVIGTGLDGATSATLARIASVSTEDLKKSLPSIDASDARETLQDAMVDFRNTMTMQAGGERTFANLYNAAERLTYTYMSQGSSAKDAADKAYSALIGDKYTIVDRWRAPIQYDADLIERGASAALSAITPDDLAFTAPAGMDEAFVREQVMVALEDAEWVTMPDESGLAVYLNGEALLGKDGQPITRSWEELIGVGADSPSALQFFEDNFKQGVRNMNSPRVDPYQIEVKP